MFGGDPSRTSYNSVNQCTREKAKVKLKSEWKVKKNGYRQGMVVFVTGEHDLFLYNHSTCVPKQHQLPGKFRRQSCFVRQKEGRVK